MYNAVFDCSYMPKTLDKKVLIRRNTFLAFLNNLRFTKSAIASCWVAVHAQNTVAQCSVWHNHTCNFGSDLWDP